MLSVKPKEINVGNLSSVVSSGGRGEFYSVKFLSVTSLIMTQ